MTEDELKKIEEHCKWTRCTEPDDVEALIAEVRRLQELLARYRHSVRREQRRAWAHGCRATVEPICRTCLDLRNREDVPAMFDEPTGVVKP